MGRKPRACIMVNPDRTPTPVAPEPILIPATVAARLCGIGKTSWYALHASGRVPSPVRWDRRELEAWTAAGCPGRERWAAIREGGRR